MVFVILVVLLISLNFSHTQYAAASKIPDWVKNIFIWYGQDKISEDEVLNAIKFLIQNNIIQLESTSTTNPPEEEKTNSNTLGQILDIPYSWTENNFKYTLVKFYEIDTGPQYFEDEPTKYGIGITCKNLLKSSNHGSFQPVVDIKLKTDVENIWDLKFGFGLNACRGSFNPDEEKSDFRSYFEINKNEKPDMLIVSTHTGEQLTFNVSD